ncbi:MAG: aquaporin [archaeon]|nr:aquaporin [archaeon]
MDASIRKYIAELIGTMVLTFFGCSAAILSGADLIVTALAFGLTVVVMSVTVGKISGCHLNTAISIAMFLDKKISSKDLAGYVIFQIIGAIIAGALIFVIIGMGLFDLNYDQFAHLAVNGANGIPYGDNGLWVALLTEIVLTFFFVLVVFGATSKNSGAVNGGLYIGLALTMVHIASMNITGTSVNPARSIAMAIFSTHHLADVWIFIVAPIIGGVLAWAVWRYLLDDNTADAE